MTPEDQIEFQNKITENRYQLIAKCDSYLQKEMDSTNPNWEDINKAAGIRIHFFRELLEMAAMANLSRSHNPIASLPADYGNWLSMVDKGADDEQHEEEKK